LTDKLLKERMNAGVLNFSVGNNPLNGAACFGEATLKVE